MTASPTITSIVTSNGRSPPFSSIPVGGTLVGALDACSVACSVAADGVLSTVGTDVACTEGVTVSSAATGEDGVSVIVCAAETATVTVAVLVATTASAGEVDVVGRLVVTAAAAASVPVIPAVAVVPGVTSTVTVDAKAAGVGVVAGCCVGSDVASAGVLVAVGGSVFVGLTVGTLVAVPVAISVAVSLGSDVAVAGSDGTVVS